ncbi:MAG: hypothetical protein ACK5N8_04400 [Alphaproteobacteria bacterium]
MSAGKIFKFGGLTLSLSADTKDNYSAYLTYNISIGKVPDKNELFSNSQTKMTDYGSVHAKVYDENGNPIQNAKIWVTGTEKAVYTDEGGEALITDIQPMKKAHFSFLLMMLKIFLFIQIKTNINLSSALEQFFLLILKSITKEDLKDKLRLNMELKHIL